MLRTLRAISLSLSLSLLLLSACGKDGVSDEEGARAAYLGLDFAVQKAMQLGFDGFNAASSANIPPQMTTGAATGTMDVTGQVDQGASANKGMRLDVALIDYSDETDPDAEVAITYDTNPDALPRLTLQLRSIPNGTMTGTFVGTFSMRGDLEGDVTLNLSFSGAIEQHPSDEALVRRVAGSTTVTGTATSQYGVYAVELTI
ncbi:MAG: hypothetical protein KF901_26280 [Myxococcales bacterium]|nr:hypothetical protein [Myxococcales bacterium]